MYVSYRTFGDIVVKVAILGGRKGADRCLRWFCEKVCILVRVDQFFFFTRVDLAIHTSLIRELMVLDSFIKIGFLLFFGSDCKTSFVHVC